MAFRDLNEEEGLGYKGDPIKYGGRDKQKQAKK
jgi:hypothetical protein